MKQPRPGGFTKIDLAILIAAAGKMIAVWVFYLTPRKWGAPARAGRINCVSNLKQVGLAFRMWSNDHAEQFPWQASAVEGGFRELTSLPYAFLYYAVVSNELNSPRILVCPEDKDRTRATTWFLQSSNLSYFVGLSADETKPNTILSGDRNISTNSDAHAGILTVQNAEELRWTKDIHKQAGNIGLADGSVTQVMRDSTERFFKSAVRESTNGIVRLVIP